MCVRACAHMHMKPDEPRCACGGQRTTCRHWFSASTTGDLGMELGVWLDSRHLSLPLSHLTGPDAVSLDV